MSVSNYFAQFKFFRDLWVGLDSFTRFSTTGPVTHERIFREAVYERDWATVLSCLNEREPSPYRGACLHNALNDVVRRAFRGEQDNLRMCQLLLKHGVNGGKALGDWGEVLDPQAVEFLLENGADPNEAYFDGLGLITPLEMWICDYCSIITRSAFPEDKVRYRLGVKIRCIQLVLDSDKLQVETAQKAFERLKAIPASSEAVTEQFKQETGALFLGYFERRVVTPLDEVLRTASIPKDLSRVIGTYLLGDLS